MPFQDALKARLDLMTPSKDTVARCLREHPPRLSPGGCFLIAIGLVLSCLVLFWFSGVSVIFLLFWSSCYRARAGRFNEK